LTQPIPDARLPPIDFPKRVSPVTDVSDFVDFSITVCGIEELDEHAAKNITHVLSILDPGWPEPDAFGSFGEHERLSLRFEDIIDELPGKDAPQPEHVEQLLRFGRDLASEKDAHLLVHCQMGISRSTAAMTLILAQARRDRPPADALAEVARIRRKAWPNLRMIEFGDEMLGLKGDLIRAAEDRYGYVLSRRPDLGPLMIEMGRAREVGRARPIPPDPDGSMY
jgi:predicted protein tyrosine phosphatase